MARRNERRRRRSDPSPSEEPKSKGGGGVCGLIALLLIASAVFLPATQVAIRKDGTVSEREGLVSGERTWVLIIDVLAPEPYAVRKGDTKKGKILEQGKKHWRIDWIVAGGTWGGIVVLGGLMYLVFGGRKKKRA